MGSATPTVPAQLGQFSGQNLANLSQQFVTLSHQQGSTSVPAHSEGPAATTQPKPLEPTSIGPPSAIAQYKNGSAMEMFAAGG